MFCVRRGSLAPSVYTMLGKHIVGLCTQIMRRKSVYVTCLVPYTSRWHDPPCCVLCERGQLCIHPTPPHAPPPAIDIQEEITVIWIINENKLANMKYSKGNVYMSMIKMAMRGTYSSEGRKGSGGRKLVVISSLPNYLEFSPRMEQALEAAAPAFPALRRSIIKESKLKMNPEQPERWDILPWPLSHSSSITIIMVFS